MSRQLYFECASGISGDMTVAALLDLGADEKTLRETLGTLPIEEPYEIHISRVKKSSLDVCDFLVKLPRDGEFLDHDMEYLTDISMSMTTITSLRLLMTTDTIMTTTTITITATTDMTTTTATRTVMAMSTTIHTPMRMPTDGGRMRSAGFSRHLP